MVGKGWLYGDYQIPLPPEYRLTAARTARVHSTELTEVGLPRWPFGLGQGCWERIVRRERKMLNF